MKILSFLGEFLGAFIKSLFCKSVDERLGISEEENEILKAREEARRAIASVTAPSNNDELDKTLKEGRL